MAKGINHNDIFSEMNFNDLQRGDIVKHKISGMSYVITSSSYDSAIAVRQLIINNPFEWEVLKPVDAKSSMPPCGDCSKMTSACRTINCQFKALKI